MKQLLLILSIGLLTVGSAISQNRYSEDEVTKNNGIIVLVSDGSPVTGIVYSEYEKGQLKVEINYKDGEKDGLYSVWRENGQLWKEGNYKDGKLDGLIKGWYENGQLWRERNYKDGERISEKEWDEDGNLTKDE